MAKPTTMRGWLSKEDILHEDCIRKGEINYPNAPFIHCPNEGKRTGFEQVKYLALKGIDGVSDILFTGSSGENKGIWIELKVGKNKLTLKQFDFLVQMHAQGYAVSVVYDKTEDFLLVLQKYHESPSYFKNGIVVCKGEVVCMDYAEVKKTFVNNPTGKIRKRKINKSFENKAFAKFGKPLSAAKLPNAGKLFRSPKK
jgi:hypothetical protein